MNKICNILIILLFTVIWEYDVLDGETFGEYKYAPDLPALRTLLLR